ncbi:MAG: amidohydrolase family protein [Oscillospiraceae bacterium]|nr:amidohydrolase family protein [Oscillospiraceae bacterium]
MIEPQYEIADAHTHIFPQKIAEKAAHSIADFYKVNAGDIGTVDILLNNGARLGISHYLVCSVATSPRQVPSINQFIRENCSIHPEFIGFGTIHPGMTETEMITEAVHMKERGLAGVKLHPDIQDFLLDDPHMFALYRMCEKELGLPILFHCGDARYDRSSPRRLAHVLEKFPDLSVIGAHFGGYSQWEEAFSVLKDYDRLRMDTSSSLSFLSDETAMRLIEGYGAERLMFGTDYPLWVMEKELDRFFSLPLTKPQRRQILFGTFSALFGIPARAESCRRAASV